MLCCGQVRCTELNSTTTMAKRAAETKEGYPCFLTPSLLADQSPGALSEQRRATSGEARGMTNSESQLIYQLHNNSSHAHFVPRTVKMIHAHKPHKNLSVGRWSRLPLLTRRKQSVASPQPCLTLKHTAARSLCLSISAPPSPALRLSSTGNMDRLLHICK